MTMSYAPDLRHVQAIFRQFPPACDEEEFALPKGGNTSITFEYFRRNALTKLFVTLHPRGLSIHEVGKEFTVRRCVIRHATSETLRHLFIYGQSIYLVFRTHLQVYEAGGDQLSYEPKSEAKLSLRSTYVAQRAFYLLFYDSSKKKYEVVGSDQGRIQTRSIRLHDNPILAPGSERFKVMGDLFLILGKSLQGDDVLLAYSHEFRHYFCLDDRKDVVNILTIINLQRSTLGLRKRVRRRHQSQTPRTA